MIDTFVNKHVKYSYLNIPEYRLNKCEIRCANDVYSFALDKDNGRQYMISKDHTRSNLIDIPITGRFESVVLEDENSNSYRLFDHNTPSYYDRSTSAIVDTQSICSLINNRSTEFDDGISYKIANSLGLLANNGITHRIGASGYKHGVNSAIGDCFEYSIFNQLESVAQCYSSYGTVVKKSNRDYHTTSNASGLNRYAYCQTAFLPRPANKNIELSTIINCRVTHDTSVNTFMKEFRDISNLHKYGAIYRISGTKISSTNSSVRIRGRIPSDKPAQVWSNLSIASSMGIEDEFELSSSHEFAAVGTYYKRNEYAWEYLSEGKAYQADGHFHALTVRNSPFSEKYEVFHLRDILVDKGSQFSIELFPVESYYRIYPIEKKNTSFYCATTRRKIDSVNGGFIF